MKILYLECNSGIAGDMLMSALSELFDDREKIVEELNALSIPGVKYEAETIESCGIFGTHIRVLIEGREEESRDVHEQGHHHHHGHDHHHHDHDHHHDHHHHHDHSHDHVHDHSHTGMTEIGEILDSLDISDQIREKAKEAYRRIAEAESQVHGKDVSEIHFHEVGDKDAIADIVGSAYLIEKLGADRIVCSPIMTGYGKVRCAHGILPVPAPATALLLRDIPSYAGQEEGEHTTPTGAALAGTFAREYGQRPLMKIRKIGYGMGIKKFASANCLRAFLGENE
ncbi:MAG: LarC family nickel insertion protein [Eubacterium sp.]|nr:LarC family nickel insertion protein [Eubacterium sp.]